MSAKVRSSCRIGALAIDPQISKSKASSSDLEEALTRISRSRGSSRSALTGTFLAKSDSATGKWRRCDRSVLSVLTLAVTSRIVSVRQLVQEDRELGRRADGLR